MIVGMSTMSQWNQLLPTNQVLLFQPGTTCPSTPIASLGQLNSPLSMAQAALADDGTNEAVVVAGYDYSLYAFGIYKYVPGSPDRWNPFTVTSGWVEDSNNRNNVYFWRSHHMNFPIYFQCSESVSHEQRLGLFGQRFLCFWWFLSRHLHNYC